ncbi:MAG: sigma-70 family RNA polymerase sigma factor [Fibrobacter sp.]|nr:sigma-70 family RNA polymerase sigma factor [Thermoguttaceae bacterium]MBQ3777372.1 sigma-70 family RNA polymerase sigma factor [Fibrobacter sp.]
MPQKINARTQYFLDNPRFIYAAGRKYGIPEQELADYQQFVLMRSLATTVKHTKDMMWEALHFCRNRAMVFKKHLKRNDRFRRIHPELRDKNPTPERQVEGQEESLNFTMFPDSFNLTAKEQKNLHILLDLLTERQKECFLLLLTGKTQKDIAEVMNLSRARICHIVKQIRAKYKKIS